MHQTFLEKQVLNRWRGFIQRRRGVELAPGYRLGAGLRFRLTPPGSIVIGSGCWIEDHAVLDTFGGKIRLGKNVFVGPHAVIYGHGGVEVGDDCLVAMHCRILSSNHTVPPFGTPVRTRPDRLLPAKLGRDVWLGAGVTVLGGVTIGDGCVVGAGAVVTKDLPPGSIAHGVPARVHGRREGSPDA